MLTITAKGLGRYRIEDQSTGYVLNFLRPVDMEYHMSKVLKMTKREQAAVIADLNAYGKTKIQRVAA